jgi:iron complex outermembrane recepter protein
MKKAYWLLSAGAFAIATPAYAQDETQTTPSPVEEGATQRTDPDIIVTAQGRQQILQDVPLAVSAVSSESLQNSGASDIRQLNQLAPSLLVSSTGTEANGSARIRGIGTVGDNPGLESSVAVFIDGVYRSRSGIGLNELGEVERVEVLRGPQGTLFGRNASAGLIHVITRRPEFTFGGYGEISYGNYDYLRAAGAVTGPISDTLAFRLDGVYSRRDGFYYDPANDVDINNRDRLFLRGQLLFEPNDALSVRLIGDFTTRDERCCAAVYVSPSMNPFIDGLVDPAQNNIVRVLRDMGQNLSAFNHHFDRTVSVTPGRGYGGETDDWGLSMEVNWDFGGATLTSITAYRDYKSSQGGDLDYGTVDILYRADDGDSFR